jgi:hypothetical protein
MPLLQLTNQHRADLQQLTGLAENDLRLIWQEFNNTSETLTGLMDVLPQLVSVYGSAAATLGADFYDELRAAEGVKGLFTAFPAEAPDLQQAHALAGWAVNTGTDQGTTLTLVTGGLQRIIANQSRTSVAVSSVADPKAEGWQRAGSGECHFCAMLVGRGEVYSKHSADFASHDHCHCYAVPAFGGRPRLVKPYTPTTKNVTDADRARVRAYMAANPQ